MAVLMRSCLIPGSVTKRSRGKETTLVAPVFLLIETNIMTSVRKPEFGRQSEPRSRILTTSFDRARVGRTVGVAEGVIVGSSVGWSTPVWTGASDGKKGVGVAVALGSGVTNNREMACGDCCPPSPVAGKLHATAVITKNYDDGEKFFHKADKFSILRYG